MAFGSKQETMQVVVLYEKVENKVLHPLSCSMSSLDRCLRDNFNVCLIFVFACLISGCVVTCSRAAEAILNHLESCPDCCRTPDKTRMSRVIACINSYAVHLIKYNLDSNRKGSSSLHFNRSSPRPTHLNKNDQRTLKPLL